MARATIFIFSVFGRPSSPRALPASLCLTQTGGRRGGEGGVKGSEGPGVEVGGGGLSETTGLAEGCFRCHVGSHQVRRSLS